MRIVRCSTRCLAVMCLCLSGSVDIQAQTPKSPTNGSSAPAAQYNLALAYRRGNGTPQDYKEFIRWLTSAADQNVLPAVLDLGSICLHPPDDTAPDIGGAIHYYEKAADLGSVPAEAMLGSIFVGGADGKPDYEQAVKWYRKAAEQGQPDAQFGLGVLYALGQGIPLDPQEALRLFTAAAGQGHAGAQYDLATMYEDGKSVPSDPSLAAQYYQLAADQGMPRRNSIWAGCSQATRKPSATKSPLTNG